MKNLLLALVAVLTLTVNANAFCNAEVQTENVTKLANVVLHLKYSELNTDKYTDAVEALQQEADDWDVCADAYPEDFNNVDTTKMFVTVELAEKNLNAVERVANLFN